MEGSCHHLNICLVGLRSTTRNFSLNSLFQDRDLNPEATENEAGMSAILLRPLVCCLTYARERGGSYANFSVATILPGLPYGSTDSTNVNSRITWNPLWLTSGPRNLLWEPLITVRPYSCKAV
jgi:hypothetical protein